MISYQYITRIIVGLLSILLGSALYAEDPTPPNSYYDETPIVWRDVAPSLAGLREANPEIYNTMADGTYGQFHGG